MRTRGLFSARRGRLYLEADAAAMPPDFWKLVGFRNWNHMFADHAVRWTENPGGWQWRPVWVETNADDLRFMQRWHGQPNTLGLRYYDIAEVRELADIFDYSPDSINTGD